MPTTTLHAGSSFASLGFGASPVVTGSGAVWDDGSDATYVDVDILGSPGAALASTTLDALTLPTGATVSAIRMNLRATATLGSPCRLDMLIHNRDATSVGTMGPVIAPCDGGPGGFTSANEGWYLTGGPTSLTHTFDGDDYAYWAIDQATLLTLLQTGANIAARMLGNTPSTAHIAARVFEVTVDVDYEAPAAIPPRRIFQRRDGATHGAPSLFGSR